MKENKYIHLIDSFQVALLVLFSPFFIFPKPHYWPIFLLVPLLMVIRRVTVKEFFVKTPIDLPLCMLLIALLVSAIRVTDFSHNLPKISGVFFAIIFFYAVVAVLKSEKILKWAVSLFLAGGFFVSIVGLLGMPTFKVKHLHFLMKIKDKIPQVSFRLPGAEQGFATNAVGGTLLLFIPLFLAIAFWGWKTAPKRTVIQKLSPFIAAAGLLVTGFVLLMTQSRGSWGGLFIASLIIGFLILTPTMKRKKPAAALLVSLIVVGLLLGIALYSTSHSPQLKPGIKQAEGTLLFRLQLWDLTVPVVNQNPLWGIGLNNFRLIPEVRFFLSHCHNQLLHTAVELGLPALIAYLAILIMMAVMCIQVWKHSKGTWFAHTALGLGTGQLAFLFFGITDVIPFGAKLSIFFWLSTALIVAVFKVSKDSVQA